MRILIFLLLSSVTLIKVHSNVIPETETEIDKNKTAQEFEEMTKTLKKVREYIERRMQEFFEKLEAETRQIEEKAQETENDFQMQLATLQEEIRKKEEHARQQVEDKKAEALEALRLQAEQRKDREWQQMMMTLNKPPPPPERRDFNLRSCIGSLFSNC